MRSGSNPLQLSTIRMLVYATLPTLVLLCVAEFTVRLTGAAQSCPGYSDSFLWACDPILYFKANPYQVINGHRLINHAGFRSDEFGPKRSGTYRIIALGDSCTFGVTLPKTKKDEFYIAEPYPQRLQRMVTERLGPGRVEVLNAGVPGYNSYQGVMLLRTKLRGLRPDLITVRFGWNDHMMSRERQIGNAFHEPSTWVGLKAQDLLLRTALYPFSLRLGMMLRAHWQSAQPEPSLPAVWTPNIPIDEYKHNLARIVELGRSQGAAVWLLTAPHALLTEDFRAHVHELAPDSPARLLLQLHAVPSFERLVEIHESYNAATREVGAALGVPVIDMEAAYRQHAAEHLFSEDVLHPTQEGHDLEAEVLYERLVAEKVLVRGEK
ncbi:MAG: SGNH/GDSL hydrolase family protein [Candidatus Binatia bacterium]|jgi:lysophospholipase L1-like esterase